MAAPIFASGISLRISPAEIFRSFAYSLASGFSGCQNGRWLLSFQISNWSTLPLKCLASART